MGYVLIMMFLATTGAVREQHGQVYETAEACAAAAKPLQRGAPVFDEGGARLVGALCRST